MEGISRLLAATICTLALLSTRGSAQLCAYVANYGADTVSVIDTATLTVIRTIVVGPSPTLPAVSPDGRFVYVTITNDFATPGMADGEPDFVAVIDTASGEVVDSIGVGDGPKGIAFTPDGHFAYVADNFSDQVSVIDTENRTVSKVIPVDHLPDQVAASPDGLSVYVTNFGSGTVSVIDTASQSVLGSIPVGGFPAVVAFAEDGALAYVTDRLRPIISVLNTESRTLATTIPLSGASLLAGIVTTADDLAYVAAEGTGAVILVDLVTRSVAGAMTVGVRPKGVAIMPDGSAVYVANFLSNAVAVINTATRLLTVVPVGNAPKGVAIAPVTGSCPPPATPEPTASPTDTAIPTATATPTPSATPTVTPAVACCFCPTPGGNDDCTAPTGTMCPPGCSFLPNARCVDPGTSLANCVSEPSPGMPTSTPTATATPPACTGACGGQSVVTEADLHQGIALIFDPNNTAGCALATFDEDDTGVVTAAELVSAVRNAIGGCPTL